MMPTVLRHGPFRFFFYSGDRDEPIHVHVERKGRIAKFWLFPVRLERSGGLRRNEISEIHRILLSHQEELQEAWNEYFHG
jgi:hypothetical protein